MELNDTPHEQDELQWVIAPETGAPQFDAEDLAMVDYTLSRSAGPTEPQAALPEMRPRPKMRSEMRSLKRSSSGQAAGRSQALEALIGSAFLP